jgi:hypothetical protein
MSLRRTRAIALGALGSLALAGCDSSNGPDLTGMWSGSLTGQCALIVTAALTESDGGVITGTATVTTPVSCGFLSPVISFTVSGEHNHPNVVLTLDPVPGQGVTLSRTFSGEISGADSIAGALDGTSVTLVRQSSP